MQYFFFYYKNEDISNQEGEREMYCISHSMNTLDNILKDIDGGNDQDLCFTQHWKIQLTMNGESN